jgi:ribosome-associated protein
MQDPQTPVSKSQRKRDAKALQELGEALVDLSAEQLQRIELPASVREAVTLAQGIRQHGGRKRQIQYIGKLLRSLDAEPIRAALETLEGRSREAAARHHRLERWRDRLLEEGDGAVAELMEVMPSADSQHLRQLVRNARREAAAGQPPRAARSLFRYLRDLDDATS